jgi:exosortase D (VPLPA-CTERM-specific)
VHAKTPALIYELPARSWILIAAAFAVALTVFHAGVLRMADTWFSREEYSHGVLIPIIAAFLIWQRKPELQQARFVGSWAGVGIVVLGGLLKVIGDIGTFYVLQQYALLVTIYGLVLALTGWQVFKILWVPLLILLFMIPLPEFLLQAFSAHLQLISSQIGVVFIRAFGISVYVEGNVIDLGGYKLQVAEACDGLRYLFPLMTLGFLMAYFFKVATWKRAVLFLSSIPVTILMNSFRIGMIGVMVEHYGISMAEGFLHQFQGWAVFMTSVSVMLLELMLLARIGKDARPWRDVFGLQFPEPAPRSADRATRQLPHPFIASAALLALLFVAAPLMPERTEIIPQREAFVSFPNRVGTWDGKRSALESIYLDALKLNDYVMTDFVRSNRDLVNFFVAWYDTQEAGRTTHSPRVCLPAGGWQIADLQQVTVPGVQVNGVSLRVNRVEIQLGNQRQLVYYWFQQRGRVITNEYLAKWFLSWDSFTRHRTDGALVRLITPMRTGEAIDAGDRRLSEFAATIAPRLEPYIPD